MTEATTPKQRKGTILTDRICEKRSPSGSRSKPFTPHDLRRAAATLAGDIGFDDAWIARCLDHAASRKGDTVVPTVTGTV